jgi:hypothetical protein
MTEKFNNWNTLKQKINNKKETLFFRERDIYFMSIGQNIGFETLGKGKLFLRPVLVYKKLNKNTFIGIPLTSKIKNGTFYFNFKYIKDKDSTAMLNQIKMFDIKRCSYKSGMIKREDFRKLDDKLLELITPSKNEGSCTSVQKNEQWQKSLSKEIKLSISNKNSFVNENKIYNSIYVASQVIKLLIKKGHKIEGSKVLVLGITFKENCPDIRNSRVIDVIRELEEFGCVITVSDYLADKDEVKREYNIELIENGKLRMDNYNAVVLAVAHDEFREIKFDNDNQIVYDIKSILDKSDGRL